MLNRKALRDLGFEGFATLREVLSKPSILPTRIGTYVVLRPTSSEPTFLKSSPAGRFKNLDPSYGDLLALKQKWVSKARIVYIGKAGPSPRRHLQRRVGELLRFGDGKAVAHRGGRALWHLKEVWSYQIAWMPCRGNPRRREKALIAEFEGKYGRLPFANYVR